MRLSEQDADALRLWFTITAAAYSEEGPDLPMPGRPLGLMLLVYLALQPDGVATYGALRSACRLKTISSLSNAAEQLEEGKLVWRVPGQVDGRLREVHLRDKGRIAVGQLLEARHPESK